MEKSIYRNRSIVREWWWLWGRGKEPKPENTSEATTGWRRQADRLIHKDSRNSAASVAAAAKSLQPCPTLRDPLDGSPPGSPVPGILQARTLEWVAISFSSAWKWKVKVKSLSRVWLFATPWTAAHQAPLSMGFSGQECWSGVPLPSQRNSAVLLISCFGPVKSIWTSDL